MHRKPVLLLSFLLFALVLLACQAIESPDNPISDDNNLVSPEILEPTTSSIPENVTTATVTSEKTEEERMHEYCIQRAKEVGIDLGNFANSNNFWLTEHQDLANLEEAFNTSFTDNRAFKTMIVVGYDSLNSQSRYDKASTTAEGKKIMDWLEVVYKKTDGNYQLVLLPIHVWDIESKTMYDKPASYGGPRYAIDIYSEQDFNRLIKNGWYPDGETYNPDWDNFSLYVMNNISHEVWVGPGALISFNSDYPEDGGTSPEIPSFDAKEYTQFQQTGEAGFFPYFIIEPKTKLKLAFCYPFQDYGSLSTTDDYANQVFIEEFLSWYYAGEMLNPNAQPYIRHWQAIP